MTGWTYSADQMGRRPTAPAIPKNPAEVFKDKRHANACRQFLNYIFRYDTVKRVELEREWNMYRLYDRGKQWLLPSRRNALGANRFYNWEPMAPRQGQSLFPRPTHNIFSPALQDEVARLVKVGTKPYIKIDDPEKDEGGLLAKRVLTWRNEVTDWSKQNRVGCYHAATFGQWIHSVRWQANFMDQVMAPSPDATMCSNYDLGCKVMLQTPEIGPLQSEEARSRGIKVTDEYDGDAKRSFVDQCPKCGADMIEADAPEEDFEGKDIFQRPLQTATVNSEDVTEVVSPWSFFPENQGVGYESDADMTEYGIRTARTVPWLKTHYENTQGIKPEMDTRFLDHHPSVLGNAIDHTANQLWNNHRLEDVFVMKPTRENPRGMLMVMTGDRLLVHTELFLPGTDVPRFDVKVAQWELRDGEIWGKPLSEDMAPLQRVVNSSLAQGMDIMQKHASPKVMLHEGMTLNFVGGTNSGNPGDVWTMDTRGVPPQIAEKYPHFFGNTGTPDSIFKILEIAQNHVPEASGARSVETGNVSGSELNYSALLFAAQKSAERRGPRTIDIRNLKIGIWKTRLRMIASQYTTPRLMKFQDDAREWHVEELRGFQLQDQTDVTLEEEAAVDSGVAKRASIQQAYEMGTLKVGMSAETDAEINRAIDLPEDLNRTPNMQLDCAKDEWHEFLRNGIEPFVDPTTDDGQIHLAIHNSAMNGRDGDDLKKSLVGFVTAELPEGTGPEYGWQSILRITWSWEKMLGELLSFSDALENAPKPEKMAELGAPPAQIFQVQQQLQQAEQMLGPEWPEALELQINEVWTRMIEAAGLVMVEPLYRLVRFNAHRLAHYKLVQQSAAMGMAPEQGAPAPGPQAGGGAPSLPAPIQPPASVGAAQAAA